MFPLPILPLPGEMVQLHVFEPRYQMLFDELEGMDLEEFGIPFSKQNNLAGVGSVMRLLRVPRHHAYRCLQTPRVGERLFHQSRPGIARLVPRLQVQMFPPVLQQNSGSVPFVH